MDDPGRIRWGELFHGRREWIAADVSPEGLRLFGSEVVDPLRAMEDSGMIELQTTVREGREFCESVRITGVCSWVQRLIDEGDPGSAAARPAL